MAFEIVDGMTGTKHISSDDLSALNIATIGKADCVLEYGDNFKLTMASANNATLGTGVGMVGGKRFWNQAATSLTVQSGTQGQKRNDLVVARYAKTGAGIESITPIVIKGTPSTGTAADPAVTSNDLKLWRIPLNGISVGTPVKLFDPEIPLATLKDSISPRYLGGKNVNMLGCVIKIDCWIIATYILIVKFTYVSGSMSSQDAYEGVSDVALVLPEHLRPKSNILATAFVSERFGKSICAVIEPSGAVKLYFSTRSKISGYGFENCACYIPLAI